MPIKTQTLAALNDVTEWINASEIVAGMVVFQLVGAGWTGTVTFEAYCAGAGPANAKPIMAEDVSTGLMATTASADGIYRIDATGQLWIRAKLTTATAGQVAVYPGVALG